MEKLKFARLISLIQRMISTGEAINEYEITEIDRMVTSQENKDFVSAEKVDNLLQAMIEHRKIEAIKAYRVLTNSGLKESKDAVEKYWWYNPQPKISE